MVFYLFYGSLFWIYLSHFYTSFMLYCSGQLFSTFMLAYSSTPLFMHIFVLSLLYWPFLLVFLFFLCWWFLFVFVTSLLFQSLSCDLLLAFYSNLFSGLFWLVLPVTLLLQVSLFTTLSINFCNILLVLSLCNCNPFPIISGCIDHLSRRSINFGLVEQYHRPITSIRLPPIHFVLILEVLTAILCNCLISVWSIHRFLVHLGQQHHRHLRTVHQYRLLQLHHHHRAVHPVHWLVDPLVLLLDHRVLHVVNVLRLLYLDLAYS